MLVPSIFSDNFFDDFFEFPFIDDREERNAERKLYGHHAANLMKTDIKEFDDKYEVEIDLPGFKKDEVQVELRDGYLVVSAEKGLDEDEKDKKSGKYLRRERYGSPVPLSSVHARVIMYLSYTILAVCANFSSPVASERCIRVRQIQHMSSVKSFRKPVSSDGLRW